jgi:hypothetical protein
MNRKSRGNERFTNGAITGALLIFIVLCLATGLGSLFDLLDSSESLVHFGGQKALADDQDAEDAKVDSFLTNDTLIVVDTTAAPGESFWLTVNLTNTTIPVSGFGFILAYNSSIIYPDTIMTNPCAPESLCTLVAVAGYKTERTEEPFAAPFVWGGRLVNNNSLDTLKFAGLVDIFEVPYPHLPIGGSGPVVRFRFNVDPGAEPGVKDTIRFVLWDGEAGNWASTLSDTIGLDNFIPETKAGIFTVSGGGPGENHCPVFTSPVSDYFQVNEGVTLEFDVTAIDEDMDTISLTMDPLDPDDLNYNFESKVGEGVVTSRFDYTPAFDEAPAFRYVRFRVSDGICPPVVRTITIEVLETAQDLLMASSLQGGVPGASERLTPFMITNSVDIYGFQFTFRWDPAKLYVDSLVATDALDAFSVWDNLSDSVHAGNATVLVFGLGGETIPHGLDTVIYPAFRVLEEAEPGPVPIQIENAREAVNPGYPSQPLGVVNGIFMVDRFGDANLDQEVDVGDVVSLVAYINDSISFSPRQESAADINQDSDVNVGDLVAMIDLILGRWMGPAPSMYPGPVAFVELDYQDLQPGGSGEIRVMADLEVPVAAAQLQINYDPDKVSLQLPTLSERSGHFLVQHRDDGNGRLYVVLFNMSNDPIPVGEGNILSLPVTLSFDAEDELGIELKEIVLADEKAGLIPVGDGPSRPVAFELGQNYPNPFNPSTTIKFTLPAAVDGGATVPTSLRIYNVLGELVRTLADESMVPGVHHKVWDGRDDQGNQVASGVYFYRLRAGDFEDTRKMVLMK